MTIKQKRIAGTVIAAALTLTVIDASALSVSSSTLEIDWNSVNISATSGLSLTPNGGFYADALYQLEVGQAWFDSVTIDQGLLPREQFISMETPVSVDFSMQDSGGSIFGSGENDATHALLETNASDQDGDNLTSNLIAASVSRGLRLEVTGAGQLGLSFDYDAWLNISAEESRYNYTSAYASSRLLVQEYVINSDGSSDYQGLVDDLFSIELSLINGTDSLNESGTLSLDINFDGSQDRLLIITMYGSSGASGASAVETLSVPEPASLALVGLGLAGLGFARRKQRQD